MQAADKTQSSHAKRRAQKKQDKSSTQEAKQADTPKADDVDRQNQINSLAFPESKVEDASMVDESQSDTKPAKNNKKGGKKPNQTANAGQASGHFKDKMKAPMVTDKEGVFVSNETGFTGDKETWFDNDLYMKPKSKANFDGAKEHDYYFNSYSSHHIHEEMLKDTNRTLTYQRAIEGNPEDFKDKIVLDIGCGTGILSIFAARAGAKHVYAVDNAEVALFAREIIKKNGFEDKITVYKGKMEEIDFPFGLGEVDIIISEWMGYYLLYESMLDCVLWARDKYLKKGTGKMLPDRAQIYVAAIEDSDY